jgi:hypothetical protein
MISGRAKKMFVKKERFAVVETAKGLILLLYDLSGSVPV